MSCADGLGPKPAKFCTYPCRGAKAYAPKYPAPKVWVQNPPGFSRTRVGAYCIRPEMFLDEGLGPKPAKFCMYPCRAQKHTPRNNHHRQFGPKIGCVFGVFGCGIVKLDEFCTYPCRAYCIRPEKSLADGLGLRPSGFLVYPDAGI